MIMAQQYYFNTSKTNMGMLGAFVTRTFYYPSILFNACFNPLLGQSWYNRIDEHVILGALPITFMTKRLAKDHNVKGVISMNEDYELRYIYNSEQTWNLYGIQLLKLATQDLFASPTIPQINKAIEFIEEIKRADGTVYVHCKAGKTRSTTVVVCYLMKCKNMNAKEAQEFIKSKRPQVWLRKPQLDCIENFYFEEVAHTK
ncbi:phosphatidylglycerophosphatase and protein-tyrosine phosphatase 1-like [Watersipora subatra]|uniref:phosphatidylglycerophosphatase and protein-tyrosine phosphatase 1-like n=1 Tax=Watersipora subatra TaxID=2589382 RepID=UPI00355C06D7